MSQISLAAAKVKTINADVTITNVTYSSGVVITGTHAYEIGDIVQISGVVGSVEANGQWIVSSISTTVSFKINSPSVSVTAYTSGGISKHLGWATPAGLIDNTVFATVPSVTLKARVESLTSAAKVRVVFEDAADSSFLTGQPLAVFQATGGLSNKLSQDKQFDVRDYEMPDLRIGASGDNVRAKFYVSGGAGGVAQFSAWLES